MPSQRKLGRATDIRLSMLRGMVTELIVRGRIETTEARAIEVKKIAEKLITIAAREKDNFETREIMRSTAKLDGKGRKVLVSKKSKNGNRYDAVDREIKSAMVQVDNPSRLAARRLAIRWLNKGKDAEGKVVNPVDKLFNEIAPKFAKRAGGYCRVIKLGPRRGDAAEMAVLEFVE
ncbi:MAG: 50S ribosomal protein L17 [Clostridia bacterium]|nr:50S ribosomal protein L17 [Clostridia bacterium]